MRALCWNGKNDVRVENVPDPTLLNPRDAIVKITLSAICGSDLHLFDGYMPGLKKGDILGHEFMGEVVDVGSEVKNLKAGDRVVVPFTICCGHCFFCEHDLWSLCDNSNPNAWLAEKMWGHSPAGLYGYTHILGGYAGGQAEYVRVPFADSGPIKVPDGVPDDKVLFLSDIFPTGYMAAENADIQPGDTVAVWGCGPVGQFTIQSAWMLGAGRVIAIDRIPERLLLAQTWGRAEVLDYEEVDVMEALNEMTGGLGPDRCIDAVGMEAHGTGLDAFYDRAKQSLRLTTDRIHALRQAIQACRKGGTLSVIGVYGGLLDKVPFGAAFNKGVEVKMGQCHVPRYMQPLLDRILADEIDPGRVISHRMDLDEAPEGYKIFRDKQDSCIKVVLEPHGPRAARGNGHGNGRRDRTGGNGYGANGGERFGTGNAGSLSGEGLP